MSRELPVGMVQGTICRCRCGHEWLPRQPVRPKVCPRCKSPYWDVSRTQQAFERVEAEPVREAPQREAPRLKIVQRDGYYWLTKERVRVVDLYDDHGQEVSDEEIVGRYPKLTIEDLEWLWEWVDDHWSEMANDIRSYQREEEERRDRLRSFREPTAVEPPKVETSTTSIPEDLSPAGIARMRKQVAEFEKNRVPEDLQ